VRAYEVERDIVIMLSNAEEAGIDLGRRDLASEEFRKRQRTLSTEEKIMYLDVTTMLHETRPVKRANKNKVHFAEEEEEEEEEVEERVDILEESKTMQNDPIPATLAVYDKDKDDDAESVCDSDTDDQPVRIEHNGIVRSGYFVSGTIIDLLHMHQLSGMDKVLSNIAQGRGSLLAHGMGTGKTLTALATVSTYMTVAQSARAIVVCPKSLILQWYAEIDRFQSVLHLKGFVVLEPSHLNRVSADWRQHGGTGVLLIGTELFRQQWDANEQVWRSTISIKSDTVVVADEAHLQLKTDTTLFFKAFTKLPTKYRILLTGTPVQNSLTEYYNMISLVDPVLLTSKETFRDTFQNKIVNSAQHDAKEETIIEGKHALKKLEATIEPVVSFASAEDLLTEVLPRKIEVVILHKYKKDDDDDEDEEEEEDQKLNSFQKLSILRDKSMLVKVDIVIDLIDAIHAAGDERTIVFSQRIETLKNIDVLRPGLLLIGEVHQADQRQLMIDVFNAQPQSILYISLKVGGTGLHLPSASRVIIVDVSWNPTWDTQAIARAYRLGQENEVFVYRLCAKDTIEMDAYVLSINKFKLASTITDDRDVGRVYTDKDLHNKLKNILPQSEDLKDKHGLESGLKSQDPILAAAVQWAKEKNGNLITDLIDHAQAIEARKNKNCPDVDNKINFDNMQAADDSSIHDSTKFATPMPIAILIANNHEKGSWTTALTDDKVSLYLAPSVEGSEKNKKLFANTFYHIFRYDASAEEDEEDEERELELVGKTEVWRDEDDPIKMYELDPQPVGMYRYACLIKCEEDDKMADGELSPPSVVLTVEEE
jgi:SNF2 family DNA or RNA helicase